MSEWGNLPSKEKVSLFILSNRKGMEVSITNYGATVTSIKIPTSDGLLREVTLGFNTLQEYLDANFYAGSSVGRYANRINGGQFSLEGKEYHVTQNEGGNHLHGGEKGFDKAVWSFEKVTEPSLVLTYYSLDGEEGYPGNLKTRVAYSLTDSNELKIEYIAETDKTTVVNLSNHTYFNLTDCSSILNHEVFINADHYTPVNSELIPTGNMESVSRIPFDFREPKKIGTQINQRHDQLKIGHGFDHNFVLNNPGLDGLAASVKDTSTGLLLEVYTTQPGVQFYTGNFLDGTYKDRMGKHINRYAGLCLETQHFPDSPNQPQFPITTLQPNHEYRETTVYKFINTA